MKLHSTATSLQSKQWLNWSIQAPICRWVYSDLLTSLPLGFPALQDTATVSQGLTAHPQRLHAGYRGVTGELGLKQILPQKVPEQDCKRELNSAIWCEKNREKYELRNSQPEPCAEPLLVWEWLLFFFLQKNALVFHTHFFLKKKHNGFFKKKKKHLLTFPSVWSISNRAIKTLKPFNMLFFLNDVGNVVLKMTLLGWKSIHFWNVCSIFEREALCTAQWFIEELLLQCSENSWRIIK